jgi:hypothetical protein
LRWGRQGKNAGISNFLPRSASPLSYSTRRASPLWAEGAVSKLWKTGIPKVDTKNWIHAMKCRIPPLLSKQSFTTFINRGKVSPIARAEFEDEAILQLYSISVGKQRRFRVGEAHSIRQISLVCSIAHSKL